MTAPARKTRDLKTRGRLLAIGGAEDPDEKKMEILPYFVRMCGGKRARILVCGSPSEHPSQKERTYARLFRKIGVADVMKAALADRNEAEDHDNVSLVDRATGVFFTGGDQMRLTSLVAGTLFGERIRERVWNEGLNIAGTSAGAAAMGSTMITGGKDDGTVKRADVDLAPGLGYWREAVIDTHFSERGRVSRMLTVFAQNPQILGIGIDGDTAVDVKPGERFTVVGKGAVFVFDGRVTFSSAPDASKNSVVAITDTVVHVLPAGFGFNLKSKRPISDKGRAITKHF